MNLKSLIAAASFMPASIQSSKAWIGHMHFAGWIIREIMPEIFVELGTHTGNSYFSFCQSVLESGIKTKCNAVDTWLGDEHAGYYGQEIFEKVNLYNTEHYAEFSRLLRMTFDKAVSKFADNSVGLLHIDGFHTYEQVCHDFETWLPKLKPGAVIIFHDISVQERNFGVWKLWKELQKQYPNNLEFAHSHGLGVLQLNNAPAFKKIKWLQHNSQEKIQVINYFTALGSKQLESYELKELKMYAAELNHEVSERNVQIAGLNHELFKVKAELQSIYTSKKWKLFLLIAAPILFAKKKLLTRIFRKFRIRH